MTYEIHITVARHSAQAAQRVAEAMKWKTSEIARDPLLGDATYFYLTAHASAAPDAYALMYGAAALKEAGVQPVRFKIEHIIYDTKTGVGLDRSDW